MPLYKAGLDAQIDHLIFLAVYVCVCVCVLGIHLYII